ncbi:MAG: PfkB family carbohydrate kinase [Gaiellales bacterium]
MSAARPRIGVVGHVEWVLFGSAPTPPSAGEIVHLSDPFEEPAGGGAVVAIALARAGADVLFYTALAGDTEGAATRARMAEEGVELRVGVRGGRQARAMTILDEGGDRTIIVSQPNAYPRADDDLGWSDIEACAAVYATCGEPSALVEARRAPILVCSARQMAALLESGVRADVVIGSLSDRGEQIDFRILGVNANAIVLTDGERGGRWMSRDDSGLWDRQPLPGEKADTYGAGDTFAAGLTHALGCGLEMHDAVEIAARWGAAAVCNRGPYG